MAVRVLALNDELPDGLQKGIASEGVTSGRCLVMNVPVEVDLNALKSRLLFWLKPYQKYMLQVGG